MEEKIWKCFNFIGVRNFYAMCRFLSSAFLASYLMMSQLNLFFRRFKFSTDIYFLCDKSDLFWRYEWTPHWATGFCLFCFFESFTYWIWYAVSVIHWNWEGRRLKKLPSALPWGMPTAFSCRRQCHAGSTGCTSPKDHPF